jgi:hypothetical protein
MNASLESKAKNSQGDLRGPPVTGQAGAGFELCLMCKM